MKKLKEKTVEMLLETLGVHPIDTQRIDALTRLLATVCSEIRLGKK